MKSTQSEKNRDPDGFGCLYVVATPIGNKGDITLRALETLKNVGCILCEDAKKTIPLLKDWEISTHARTLYKSNDPHYYDFYWKGLEKGESFALVSDAGTPGISDPGSWIVRETRLRGFRIIPIPGVTAWGTLVSVSGFQANPTLFLGFLSEKKGKKRSQLEKAREISGLIVWYESVHKIPGLLEILPEVFPSSPILVGRELTKFYEEILYYPDAFALQANPPKGKGEFTILINNHEKNSLKDTEQLPI